MQNLPLFLKTSKFDGVISRTSISVSFANTAANLYWWIVVLMGK